ncbi:tetratricopeptide repeat protein [Microseira wollei]|uniref:Tetratricopeptide TPR_2 n=1 Tax=Microseira wollei NIES-4236 TaxID=2530354 RepID=A0AAV3X9S0_9CYAN|nr:tetratricopeptide repeat protein [Microseira wollei]GET36835.1 tetratricopeptide TPR_2 [Microseira wollei NIES-4236]
MNRGNALALLHRDEAAIEADHKVGQIQPESAAGIQQVKMLQKFQRYAETLAVYDKRLKLKPEDPDAWYRRGLILAKLQRQKHYNLMKPRSLVTID